MTVQGDKMVKMERRVYSKRNMTAETDKCKVVDFYSDFHGYIDTIHK
jgi:hypothetical protein